MCENMPLMNSKLYLLYVCLPTMVMAIMRMITIKPPPNPIPSSANIIINVHWLPTVDR